MYHFTSQTQLRVVRRLAKGQANASALKSTRLVVIEHILPTTQEYVRVLREAGVVFSAIIAKPYSQHPHSVAWFKNEGFNYFDTSNYDQVEAAGFLDGILQNALHESEHDGRKVVVLDVGGYFAKLLSSRPPHDALIGAIEDTTFGHNRYQEAIAQIATAPVCSVARSQLKEIEGRFVGRDAVVAMESLLRRIGISITGRNALVIGYGMIGKNVARTLKGYDLNVYVYDRDDRRLLHAFNDGFHIHKKTTLLRHADIIFSATGSEALYHRPAMSIEDIEDCKHGVILASVGSRNSEFAVRELEQLAVASEPLIPQSMDLIRYQMPNSKDVIVARNGTAVNFYLPTMAVEIIDLVFAEITDAIIALHEKGWHIDRWNSKTDQMEKMFVDIRMGILNETPPERLDYISKQWLRSVNMEAQA